MLPVASFSAGGSSPQAERLGVPAHAQLALLWLRCFSMPAFNSSHLCLSLENTKIIPPSQPTSGNGRTCSATTR